VKSLKVKAKRGPEVKPKMGRSSFRMEREKDPASLDRRATLGPCWFFATGACAHSAADCPRERRKLSEEEIAHPISVKLERKIDDKSEARFSSGLSGASDAESQQSDEGEGKWGENKNGKNKDGKNAEGESSKPCRWAARSEECPRGDKCYKKWSHGIAFPTSTVTLEEMPDDGGSSSSSSAETK
jgi:hypothetical protein